VIVRLAVADVAVEERVTLAGLIEAVSPPAKGPLTSVDRATVPLKLKSRLREIVDAADLPWRRVRE
jgi:hypothetical protein